MPVRLPPLVCLIAAIALTSVACESDEGEIVETRTIAPEPEPLEPLPEIQERCALEWDFDSDEPPPEEKVTLYVSVTDSALEVLSTVGERATVNTDEELVPVLAAHQRSRVWIRLATEDEERVRNALRLAREASIEELRLCREMGGVFVGGGGGGGGAGSLFGAQPAEE